MKNWSNILNGSLALTLLLISIFIAAINISSYSTNAPDSVAEDFFSKLVTPYNIKYVNYNDKTLRYVETGLDDPTSPIILFVHGAPGAWDTWKKYLADYDLRGKARLISVDRLGYGSSERGHSETNLTVQAASLMSILKKHQASKVIVVGHSYGGPIAAKMMADNPSKIDGVIMCAPLIDPESEPVKWYAHLADLKIVRWMMPDYIDMSTDEKMSHAAALEDIRGDWQKLTKPIYHLHGAKDKLAPCKENVDYSTKYISEKVLKKVVEPDFGHLFIWDHSATVKKYIVEIFDSVPE